MCSVTIGPARAAQGVGSLADESNREQVLGDGAKQSGGRRIEVTATIAVAKGLQQVAGDLSAQYVIQYTLPDGVKPDRRLNVSLKRAASRCARRHSFRTGKRVARPATFHRRRTVPTMISSSRRASA